MTLTKADLSEILFDRVGLNKREAKDMVEAFFEEIRNALENGDSIKLSGELLWKESLNPPSYLKYLQRDILQSER